MLKTDIWVQYYAKIIELINLFTINKHIFMFVILAQGHPGKEGPPGEKGAAVSVFSVCLEMSAWRCCFAAV